MLSCAADFPGSVSRKSARGMSVKAHKSSQAFSLSKLLSKKFNLLVG